MLTAALLLLSAAFLTLCFAVLHMFWGVLFFNGLDTKRYWLIAYVVCTHMLVSCLVILIIIIVKT